jgi:hypothetical protein
MRGTFNANRDSGRFRWPQSAPPWWRMQLALVVPTRRAGGVGHARS